MQNPITRRDFLKLSSIGVFSTLLPPVFSTGIWDESTSSHPVGYARVATTAIYHYSQPDFNSERIGTFKRDEIIPLYEEILSPLGPEHNRVWYQLNEGFVHSGYLQRVDDSHFNHQPLKAVPEKGCLGEITVPFSQSMRFQRGDGWRPLYRLYYQSVYWITGLEEGPDGTTWYRLTDDLLHVHFHVPALHMRPIDPSELAPFSPYVPPQEKRIEIRLPDQTLTAYESDQIVLETKVSSGIHTKGPSPNGIPTDTPPGRFRIGTKMPTRHMGDGQLTDDIEAYELPGVPWVCFFHIDGLALHGTYWHNNFGRKMSHGCVNLRNEDALWLYRWTTPIASFQDWFRRGSGTVIDIID